MSADENSTEGEVLEGAEKVRVMIETLKSSQLFVRVAGTEQLTLESIANPELTLPMIMKELKNPDWWTVRFGIIEAIQEIALRGSSAVITDNYVTELTQYLKDEDEDFRAKVADCLGDIKSNIATSPLIEALNNEHDETRELSAKALGKIGDEHAVDKLVSKIENDSSTYVITASLTSLGFILNNKKTFSKLQSIIELLKADNESVHRSAATALGKIGDTNGILPIIKLLNPLRKDTTPEGREEILTSLMKFSQDNILKELQANSNDDDNVLLDLIEETIFHYPFETLLSESKAKKENLISKYQRQFRKVKTEIDGINGYVADIFNSLTNITDLEELNTLADSVPRKRKSLERIDLKKIAQFNWVQKELYENLKEAQEWHKLGHGALNELEIAIQTKIDNTPIELK